MKKMTLNEIQSVSLDIMKHVHSVCERNGIKYSLGYGSLIGAIRHKGFIPWDDDVDIVMMRDDFDLFCQVYQDSRDFKLFAFSRGNMYATCARVCEMKRTLVKTGSPLFTESTGVWIDIFPLDSVDDDRSVFESKSKTVKDIQEQVFLCRSNSLSFNWKLLFHVRTMFRRLLYGKKDPGQLWDVLKQQDTICRTFAPSSSSMMSMLVFPVYISKDYCPKRVFDEVILAPFEDTLFCIMKGYDEWLTNIYDDYLTPPSLPKDRRGHTSHNYFWK